MKGSLNRDYLQGWQQIARLIRDEGKSLSGREAHCCFLNTGGEQFAHASSVTGLDYIDDGRAAALVDWDLDGDLDIWTTNRTGPRVRYLQNQGQDHGNYLAVRLVGTSCNRDAIGARLEFALAGDERKIIKTVHAGAGFLSQSSKWVHVGLGERESVQSLTIRWPGGTTDVHANLAANQRYRIVQGASSPEAWSAPRGGIELASKVLPYPEVSGKSRVVIAPRAALATLDVIDLDEQSIQLEELATGPILLNLWQTTCVPCLKELREFTERAPELRESGLQIVALHLTNQGTKPTDSIDEIKDFLTRTKFPFPVTIAVGDSIKQLSTIQKRLLQSHRRIVLPTSLLLDSDRQVAAIYKGTVSVEQLLHDVKLTSLDEEAVNQASVPFPGRWYYSPIDETYHESR